MAVFALGSLLAALSPSIHWLIGARLVQAVGGALITTNTLAIITDTFPAGKRGVAMGAPAILVSGGAAIGPTLGGFLVTHFGWEAIFYVNLPVGLIAVTLALRVLPPLRSHRALEPLDWPGAGLLMTTLASILLAITQGASWGWTSTRSWGWQCWVRPVPQSSSGGNCARGIRWWTSRSSGIGPSAQVSWPGCSAPSPSPR